MGEERIGMERRMIEGSKVGKGMGSGREGRIDWEGKEEQKKRGLGRKRKRKIDLKKRRV